MLFGILAGFVIYQIVAEVVARREERRWACDVVPRTTHWNCETPTPTTVGSATAIADRTEMTPTHWKGWREVRVARIIDESPDCRSFRLEAMDGSALPPFKAGQSILVRMAVGDSEKKVSRCYSLSGGTAEPYYRITVKRVPEGQLSNALQDGLSQGDVLEIQAPRGRFHSQPRHRDEPLVLIAAGIGITPMLAMLLENLEQTPSRRVHLFYQLRSPDHAPFLKLLRKVATERAGSLPVQLHVFFSRPDLMAIQHPDTEGRVDARQILERVGTVTGEYMICGPDAFMTSLAEGLVVGGVKADHVQYESFGGKAAGVGAVPVDREPHDHVGDESAEYHVVFNDSQDAATWTPSRGTLLDLAEESDVEVEFACRTGSCGACVCRLKAGQVAYRETPEHEVHEGEVLMCVARPTSDVTIETSP
ncbi:MAG: 2Fe-2S iron-sulfur cluster-binding protein [Planctomycetota bacterium]